MIFEMAIIVELRQQNEIRPQSAEIINQFYVVLLMNVVIYLSNFAIEII